MSEALATSAPAGGLLDRDCSVAAPNFNRWLVPPAALAIHLCIGMGYGFSVFWLPMSKLLSGPDDASCTAQGRVHRRAVLGRRPGARGIGVSMHQLWLLWLGAGIAGFLSWAAIGIPFLIGVYIAIQKAAVLF